MPTSYLSTFSLAAPLAALLFAVPASAQGVDANAGSSASGAQQAASSAAPLPLNESVRQTSTEALQQVTYDLIALQHNVHQAHWNVQGIEFYQLHEFYQELYTALHPFIDEAAERKLALGEPADGRLAPTAEASDLETISPGYLSDRETLQFLEGNYATMSSELSSAIEATSEDLVTQDLLIGIAHTIDKHFWQIRAHLERGL